MNYPPRPWSNGDTHELIPGRVFVYEQNLNLWAPLGANHDFTTVSNLIRLGFVTEQQRADLDSDIARGGRIWKTETAPVAPNGNDIWIEPETGAVLSWDYVNQTWIETFY